ncbi:PREDICTED: galactosylgalactosylxylosylprotein 3-beta-glucuronosyltransferase 2 isoform X2 [Dipodomys ordii]|uniref:Galactosylgalactosylxylosylprotein 3-beta-glucuronosyltransferase n=1 Tax=Dipodomys ordii TaxID=10020 RepID=A0A1S3GJV9_DIPOR|nr:PREDICTED: galactosylgalactosylxylosylprotein 3-beta-glucuronosyltransferase 2 isoform X2 [Dipodomys ordii]
MKSVLFSRFFILLPWILIVIIMLDVDTRRPAPPLTPRPHFSPYAAAGRGAARVPLPRRVSPGRHAEQRNESRPRAEPEPPLPTIYAITPTYSRPVQKAELTRLANTFRQVARLHWILVEDAAARSELMRTTRKVSVWPVGLVGGRRYERPLVENGKVVGWYTGWRADRPFAIDMAGFAVSLQVILSNPKAVFTRRGSQPGMQESDFLKQITTVEELEPKASNCTKVLVWHTRTEKVNLANEPKYLVDTVKIEV